MKHISMKWVAGAALAVGLFAAAPKKADAQVSVSFGVGPVYSQRYYDQDRWARHEYYERERQRIAQQQYYDQQRYYAQQREIERERYLRNEREEEHARHERAEHNGYGGDGRGNNGDDYNNNGGGYNGYSYRR